MFRASKIRSREISLKNLVFKADSGANIHRSLALNSVFAKQLSFHKTPFRMFAVNPYSILANKANIKHFLQKHNINFLTFERQNKVDSTGSGEPILATEYIKNYFIKDDSNNKLIIFQLSNNSSITYDDISKYLELQFNSISEADEKAIEEVLGLKTEASEKINDLHLPLYSSVTKVLKPYLPHDSLIPYVSKPIYLCHYQKLINLLSSDKVTYKYIELPLGKSPVEIGKMAKPKESSNTPKLNKEAEVSETKQAIKTPEVENPAQTLEVKQVAQTPEVKQAAQTPEVKQAAQTPEVKQAAQTPEVKQAAQAPEVKHPAQTPEIKKPAKTPEIKVKADVPKIKEETKVPDTVKTQKQMVESHKHELSISNDKYADFGKWYQELLIKSEMIEYYDISGCYILRPWAYSIWEQIQKQLNEAIAAEGVKNAYFPLFVSQKALEKEEKHIEGFSPEVAWITKAGTSDLSESIAVRPTSETIMYPAFSKWIRSYRDLPLKLNQWSNVVRWEFKDPTPFIRTREFLWQEGHTAHASEQESNEFCLKMLDNYSKIYEELLAIPVIKGKKSVNETFAGAQTTYTLELFIDGSGRGMQGATSHNLGQRFSKIFDIKYEDQNKDKLNVWQTCWGFTFRSIGAMIMIHSDDKGLVLPPYIAEHQVVIVPIYKSDLPTNKIIDDKIQELKTSLEKKGIRCHVDDRDNYSPGWKFNHWEVKGVPIRIDIGLNEIEYSIASCSIRVSGEKKELRLDNLSSVLTKELKRIHNGMIRKARKNMEKKIKESNSWISFIRNIKNKNLVSAPWCENPTCEEAITTDFNKNNKKSNKTQENNEESIGGVKSLCIPFEHKELKHDEKCFKCGAKAKSYTLFGRSY